MYQCKESEIGTWTSYFEKRKRFIEFKDPIPEKERNSWCKIRGGRHWIDKLGKCACHPGQKFDRRRGRERCRYTIMSKWCQSIKGGLYFKHPACVCVDSRTWDTRVNKCKWSTPSRNCRKRQGGLYWIVKEAACACPDKKEYKNEYCRHCDICY